jgi:hypothetical protein
MATAIATSNLTMLDIAKETLPDGSIDREIVEMQSQEMPILQDIPWIEANGGTYHRSTIRVGVPEVAFRMFYQGVAPVKTEKQQVDEPIGMMEARSVVDAKELDMSPNPGQTRTNEMQGIMEGFNQTFVQTLLYSSVSTSPAKFDDGGVRREHHSRRRLRLRQRFHPAGQLGTAIRVRHLPARLAPRHRPRGSRQAGSPRRQHAGTPLHGLRG